MEVASTIIVKRSELEAEMTDEAATWDKFQWRVGAETYAYEITDRGLIGRLTVSDGRKFALPVVVWEALLDAVKTNRNAKLKAETNLPPRAGARWTETESDEIAAKFRSGRSVSELAQEHGRTAWAMETQLAKLGLWDRIERRPAAAPLTHAADNWPSQSPAGSTNKFAGQ